MARATDVAAAEAARASGVALAGIAATPSARSAAGTAAPARPATTRMARGAPAGISARACGDATGTLRSTGASAATSGLSTLRAARACRHAAAPRAGARAASPRTARARRCAAGARIDTARAASASRDRGADEIGGRGPTRGARHEPVDAVPVLVARVVRNEDELAVGIRALGGEFQFASGLNQVGLDVGKPVVDGAAADLDGVLQSVGPGRRENLHTVPDRRHAVGSQACA